MKRQLSLLAVALLLAQPVLAKEMCIRDRLSDELAWMNAQRVEVSGGMFL